MASKLKSFVDGIECVHSVGREGQGREGNTLRWVCLMGGLLGRCGRGDDNVDFCVTLNICGFALLQQFDDDDVADSRPCPPSAL